MAHTGSWGLPEFGLTEWLGRQIAKVSGGAAPLTSQGGSSLFGPVSETKYAQNPYTREVSPLFSPPRTPDQPGQALGVTTSVPIQQPTQQSTQQPTQQPTQQSTRQPTQQPQQPQQPQEDPMERIRREVESIYSPLASYLGQAESAVTEEYNRYRPELEEQYAASLANIQSQKAQGERELAFQEEAARVRKEDALSAARRLYDELRRGGFQRFGGASSAGQAFTELTAQEQQRQSGNIWQAYQQTQDNINKYKTSLLENFAQAQKELELAKTSALNQAYSNYQNRLQEIRAKRAETESAKSQLALEALNNLRNQVYQINLQSLNLAQILAANRQLALNYVDQYSQKVAQSILGGSTAYQRLLGATTVSPTSNMSIGGKQATSVAPQTGVVSYKKPEDYLLGL